MHSTLPSAAKQRLQERFKYREVALETVTFFIWLRDLY